MGPLRVAVNADPGGPDMMNALRNARFWE